MDIAHQRLIIIDTIVYHSIKQPMSALVHRLLCSGAMKRSISDAIASGQETTPVKARTSPIGAKRMYITPPRTPTPPTTPPPVTPSEHDLTPRGILELLTTDRGVYSGNVTCLPRLIPAREAVTNQLSPEATALIDPDLLKAYFHTLGVQPSLFSHQAEAIEAILVERCENICISTSTSSGKSLSFNLPVLSELIRAEGEATALYIYPTKALTQDQMRVIENVVQKRRDLRDVLGDVPGVIPGVLDGDVKDMSVRREIMDTCNLVMTNPDMLHYSVIPGHKMFASFLRRLRFVVIDEAHAYHGGFGGHVSSVLRRLRRVIELYQCGQGAGGVGSDGSCAKVQFILCSATIGNPAEHVSNLVGIDCDKLIDKDGSPSGERVLTVWNCRPGESMTDIKNILSKFITAGVRFICFCKNRFAIETVLRQVRERLAKESPRLADKIVSYRAGYSAEERRRLEQQIFSGAVLGVVATTALELGMDIGSLDVAVSLGFPGSIHSLWQQWGRAGRGSRPALCLLMCREEDILDSYIGQDADERLLELPVEDAVVQINNPTIVGLHLRVADWELPMKGDAPWAEIREKFWPEIDDDTFKSAKKEAPFQERKPIFGIRSVDNKMIQIKLDHNKIDEIDISKAVFTVYPGAVHFVQGEEYRIVELSFKSSIAKAVKAKHDYFTVASEAVTVAQLGPPHLVSENERFQVARVDVSTKVSGFHKLTRKKPHDRIPGSYEALELPTISFATKAVMIELKGLDAPISHGLHGAAHAIFFAACQRLLLSSQSDIRIDCPSTLSGSRILIYDAQKGGMGAAEAIFKRGPELVQLALAQLTRCPCTTGCMRCMLLSKCAVYNQSIEKVASITLLAELLVAVTEPKTEQA